MKADSTIRMLVVGDICFDLQIRTIEYLGVYRLKTKEDSATDYDPWRWLSPPPGMMGRIAGKVRRIWDAARIHPKTKTLPRFEEFIAMVPENEDRRYVDPYARSLMRFVPNYPAHVSKEDYPFLKIAPFLQSRDFVLANLETPLARDCRIYGYFMSDPGYAKAMARAGISMVNLANNHSFDAGEHGFLQTIDHLKDAGILYTGAGDNREKARAGTFVDVKGTRLGFLGYTQFCNSHFTSIAAEYPGILPLDPEMIVQDIIAAKEKGDVVFVVLHWGNENHSKAHPRARELAHAFIDAGADGIIGHHPHVPQEIEIYKSRPILYSTGNFIFGHSAPPWSDNYLVEIVAAEKRVQEIKVYPVAGKGEDLFQPYLLTGERGQKVLRELQANSAQFGTVVDIQGDTANVRLNE